MGVLLRTRIGEMLSAIAGYLPWAKAGIRRLSKAWGFQKPQPAWIYQFKSDKRSLLWSTAIAIFVIIRILVILQDD